MNQEPVPPKSLSDFDLKALGFADLILHIKNSYADQEEHLEQPQTKIPEFNSVRCVCGNSDKTDNMIQCHECECFLHRSCLDNPPFNSKNFKCPFCKLQSDGIDPFYELNGWIESMNGDIKALYQLISQASSLENQLKQIPQQQMMGMNYRRGSMQLIEQLGLRVSDIITKIQQIANK